VPRFLHKEGFGVHSHKMADGTVVRTKAGDRIEFKSVKDLHGAKDKFRALEGPEVSSPNDYGTGLELRTRGKGWYDVVNLETGLAINDKPLRQADAVELASGEDVTRPPAAAVANPVGQAPKTPAIVPFGVAYQSVLEPIKG